MDDRGAACPECAGRRVITCPQCAGRGELSGRPMEPHPKCSHCSGRGSVPCLTHLIAWANAKRIAERDGITRPQAAAALLVWFRERAGLPPIKKAA